ncbi:MAG: hypothetical protein WA892_06215 [Ornithinimicrobium sp.]
MTNTQPQKLTTSHLDPMTRMGRAVRHHGSILKTLDAVIVRAQSLGPAVSAANHKGLRRPWTGTNGR